ncbi:CPBP family intramembrane glutamic endopeptidase [Dactylosporangium sp. NPDC051541]|uniref:CPBP family intramembrane glutamic endopeptidase n=1 Tax=Dactylosporangium sp. NPDC051541 TaxID=3363977 RepID=UPI00379DAA18
MHPNFGPVGTTVVALLAAWFVVRIARSRGTVARRRAEIESRPDGRIRFHRRYVMSWWLLAIVALTPLWTDPLLRPADYGLSVPSLAGLLFALVAFAMFVAALGYRGRRGVVASPRIAFLLPRNGRERLWGTATAFTAGICEELVFRGAFLAFAVGVLHLNLWLATLAVSLFFGLGHLYQGWIGVAGTTVFGACATILYLFSGSLLLPMLVHTAVDLAPFALIRYSEPATVGSPIPE